MSNIICGMFDRSVDADAALDNFKHEGFQRSEVDAFYVSPPGQHSMIPLGGGLGAYIGSFAGTMAKVRAGRYDAASVEHPLEPRGGRMIAINVDRAGTERRAIEVLRQHGARDVRRAEGRWSDGSWRDFDPRAPLATV